LPLVVLALLLIEILDEVNPSLGQVLSRNILRVDAE
jgi:hypothetical protein